MLSTIDACCHILLQSTNSYKIVKNVNKGKTTIVGIMETAIQSSRHNLHLTLSLPPPRAPLVCLLMNAEKMIKAPMVY
jgi:hypothetical protein